MNSKGRWEDAGSGDHSFFLLGYCQDAGLDHGQTTREIQLLLRSRSQKEFAHSPAVLKEQTEEFLSACSLGFSVRKIKTSVERFY